MIPPLAPPFPAGAVPDPEALLRGALQARQLPLSPALAPALAATGAPAADFLSTAVSARVGLLAAREGQLFVPHELRRRVPPPPGLVPEEALADQSIPLWREGVLEEPKYFSFFLDTRVGVYNPNHRRKWRPHEALHGLVGFFWRPDLTPFEGYLGARICELLPVTHWYGYDEILRPRCPRHVGRLLYRELCSACEALSARPFASSREEDVSPALLDQSRAAAARAAHYLSVELDAIGQEIDTGRRVITHHPRLDGSSDAVGYLRGHYERLTAWSFGAFAERMLAPGIDYQDAIPDLLARLHEVHRALLSEDIGPIDEERAGRLRARRRLQDMAYRAFLALEWLDPGSRAEATLAPALDAVADACGALLAGDAYEEGLLVELLDRFAAVAGDFPPEVAAAFPAPGYGPFAVPAGVVQLAEGLLSAFPASLGERSEADRLALALAFAASPAAAGPGSLRRRFGAWSAEPAVRLEGWLHDLPRRDEDAELFATLPEDDEEEDEEDLPPVPPEHLRLNATLRRARFPAAFVAETLGDPAAAAAVAEAEVDGEVELCRYWWHGEPRLLPLDAPTASALDALAAGEPLHREDLAPLLEAGVAVYLPPPRR